MTNEDTRKPSFLFALTILLSIVSIISVGILLFDAPIQILMFIGMFILIPFMMKLGYSYTKIQDVMFKSMGQSLESVLILINVGILIGTWIASGTVPALVYYGINLISPRFFLLTTLLFTSIVATTTGTSWGAIGTAGVAMMGVGETIGIPSGITAGAILSGAYFGDKMSPLSDTTNLTPTVTGATLFGHIKHMMYTAVPSFIITAILFTVIGLQYSVDNIDSAHVNTLLAQLSGNFTINFITLTPILLLIGLMLLRKPAVVSIFSAAMYGGLLAVIYQGYSVSAVFNIMYEGYTADSGNQTVNELLQRGGLTSMLPLIVLFLFALGLGGMLAESGVLEAIINSFAHKIQTNFQLTLVTIIFGYFTLAIGGAIYFSAVMTGTIMKPLYDRMNLKPENLSRTIEATSTLSGTLFPWVGAGMFATSTLGIPVSAYLPYTFLAFITPIITLIYAATGFTMTEKTAVTKQKKQKVSGKAHLSNV
ncbi:Na+/H+ antiporter NhaC [Alkalibacterium olivapovliticus]|uniref:NhaC family Na+:H+ antiporter n=1 Tax=Alkalibacterium olivapovliticus TaxID=99907 RepID=A0A2T0WAG7_9LACT|nr:Na+/H+ antiporter NhaC [Alkalibacterium olivapovliticus]PRY83626.1 NhaC family Na+:H+ antiporter [Alkalibacterium olivapovliticus]